MYKGRKIMNEELGKLLYKAFFYNNKAYAIQEKNDGEVCFFTRHQRIDANKVNYYLEQKKSVLAYQQKFDKLNWVCLDFDIVKKVLLEHKDYDFIQDIIFRPILLEEVKICCDKLDSLKIEYLMEYSGNRGIHIWILFESPITKSLGYTIIEEIIRVTPFKYIGMKDSPIGIDLFPKVPSSKNNIVGKGVKIPMSYHLKSNSYSYLIEDLNCIKRVENISEELVAVQITLLKKMKRNEVVRVIGALNIKRLAEYNEYEKVKVILGKENDEVVIIEALRKSVLFRYLFDNLSTLNESERRILVGTFARMQKASDINFGISLLKKIFSETTNYDPEITEIKIELLKNLFPPNIAHVEKILNMRCDYCHENHISNVVELIDNIEIRECDYLINIINWSRNAEKNYLNFNDEVPLTFIEDEMNAIDEKELVDLVTTILENAEYMEPVFFKYNREEGEKIRVLYSLSGRDRIISTTIMKYIYDVIGVDSISHLSYSYRISSNSMKTIFMNWNTLWMEFIKAVQSCTNHNAYDKYYVIKLDIKDFYNSINLTLLKEILMAKSNNGFQYNFLKLNLSALSNEVKMKYENAINYLIRLNESILNSNKGVPQGPAYARYLAELYLASLDEFLVSNLDEYFDFACRYVDDYYIFIKDVEKGKKLKDDLLSELGKMYLDTNDKLVFGILEDIKYDIELVNQAEKYFVDGIDDSTPELIKDEARKILSTMFKDFIENDNVKDFPFFLTHLWDDEYAKSRSEKLVDKLKKTTIGRGSLFKHFYNRIAIKYTMLEFYNEVSGLSRANLITSLMRNESYSFNNYSALINDYLSINNLEIYEKKELIRLILLKQIEFDYSLLNKEDYKVIISLVNDIPEMKWSLRLFNETIFHIQDMDNKIDAIVVIDSILSKSMSIPNNQKLVEIVYSIFKEQTFSNLDLNQHQKLYNVTSYASLYLDSNDKVKELWKEVLKSNTVSIDANQWVKYNSIIDLDTVNTKTVTSVLMQLFQNRSYIDGKTADRIEKEYAYYLFLKLSNSTISSNLDADLYELVKKVAEEQNAVPLLWCCDSGTTYYLDATTSASNIEFNNRVVLKKDNQILVRGSKDIFSDNDYQIENIHDSISMYYKIYNIDASLKNYSEKISCLDLIDIMSMSSEVIEQIKDKLVNIFEKGSLTEECSKIKYDYTQADEQFILRGREKIKANRENVINQMIEEISVLEWSKTLTGSEYKISNKLFKRLIVPSSIFKGNTIARIKYFDKLCELFKLFKKNKLHDQLNIHELEGMKIEALASIILLIENKVSSDVKEMKESFKILSVYNKIYDDLNYALLYSSETPNYMNLFERINFFRESISKNLDCSFVVDLLQDTRLMELKFVSIHGELNKFIKVDLRVINRGNLTIISIDGKEVKLNEIQIVKFDGVFDEIELTNDDLLSLNTTDIFKLGNKIVVLPEELSKAMEISSRKDNKFDLTTINNSSGIKSCVKFDDCVKNIMRQGGVRVSKEIAEGRLIKFLENKNPKYFEPVLEIISKYRFISDKEFDDYRRELVSALDSGEFSTITLKNHVVDDNGFNILIQDKYLDIFGRGKSYDDKLKRSIKNFFEGKYKHSLAIVSDVGISGKQFKTTINDYLNKTGIYNSGKLHKYEGDVFKECFNTLERVIVINCIYTDVYEKNIREFFSSNYSNVILEFKGTKISVDVDNSYIKVHEIERNLFVEFLSTYYPDYLNRWVLKDVIKYQDYLKIADKDVIDELDKCRSLLLLRHRSMPKYRHIIFDDKIYDYRKG